MMDLVYLSIRVFGITIVILCLATTGCGAQQRIETKSKSTKNPRTPASFNQIKADEVYIQLYPRDGYLHLKAYNIKSLLARDAVDAHIEDLKEKIASLNFGKSEYGFKYFDAKEEAIGRDREILAAELHLTTAQRNLRKLIDDSFAKVLKRPIKVRIDEDEIVLEFEASGIKIADNNAKNVYGNGSLRRMHFRNGEPMYEAVFAFTDNPNTTPLVDRFGENVRAEFDAKEEAKGRDEPNRH